MLGRGYVYEIKFFHIFQRPGTTVDRGQVTEEFHFACGCIIQIYHVEWWAELSISHRFMFVSCTDWNARVRSDV